MEDSAAPQPDGATRIGFLVGFTPQAGIAVLGWIGVATATRESGLLLLILAAFAGLALFLVLALIACVTALARAYRPFGLGMLAGTAGGLVVAVLVGAANGLFEH